MMGDDFPMVMEKIKGANDIKKLDQEQLLLLAEEIRKFLIQKISVNGGHLASNLGTVELTMALHLVFQLPQDKIIWDVGISHTRTRFLPAGRRGLIVCGNMAE